MTGDQDDIAARLKALLPGGWFRDETPILDGLLGGIAWALASAFALAGYAGLQARIATATDGFLDLISADLFGATLPRQPDEPDGTFRTRIRASLFLERGTRRGLVRALERLTGRTPWVFEPARADDTGGYDTGSAGYDLAGGYGSTDLPYQAFVVAYRPLGQGIPDVAGYDSPQGAYDAGSRAEYVELDMVRGVTDGQIYDAIAGVTPAGTTIWARISS